MTEHEKGPKYNEMAFLGLAFLMTEHPLFEALHPHLVKTHGLLPKTKEYTDQSWEHMRALEIDDATLINVLRAELIAGVI